MDDGLEIKNIKNKNILIFLHIGKNAGLSTRKYFYSNIKKCPFLKTIRKYKNDKVILREAEKYYKRKGKIHEGCISILKNNL